MTNSLGRALFVLALLTMSACGAADDEPAATIPGGGTPMLPLTDGCLEGQFRECRIVTSVRDGYTDCTRGMQYCQGTSWGPCAVPADGGAAKLVSGDDGGAPGAGAGAAPGAGDAGADAPAAD